MTFLGLDPIIEIIIEKASELKPDLENSLKARLRTMVSSFINGSINSDDCQGLMKEICMSNTPFLFLRSIMMVNIDCQIQKNKAVRSQNSQENQRLNKFRKRAIIWTSEEDINLLAGVLRFGIDNWSIISDIVGNNRSRAQCSQRWFRGLDPRICKKRWTSEEDKLLLEMVSKYGETSWAKISSAIGNRSDVQCRYRFHQIRKSEEKCIDSMFIKGISIVRNRADNALDQTKLFYNDQFLPSIWGGIPSADDASQNSKDEDNASLDLFLRHFGFPLKK